MTAKGGLRYAQSIRQLSISRRRGCAAGDKNPQFVEKLFLGLPFIIRRDAVQCSSNQCLSPTTIEQAIFVAHAAVGLEKRFRVLNLVFVQRQKNLGAAALESPFSVGGVREKIFQRCEQK